MEDTEFAPLIDVSQSTLDDLVAGAKRSDRHRLNLNLHVSPDEVCQRFFNAMEPETYVRPNRQLSPPKRKLLVGIRGRFAAVIFNDVGDIEQSYIFGAGSDVNCAVEVPAGVWNSIVCLESGSILLEVKSGPFNPDEPPELAPWSPEAETLQSVQFLERLKHVLTEIS